MVMKIVFSKSCENLSQSLPELSKIDPKFSQDPPQTLPNPSKIDPKSMPEASWSPSWAHAGTCLKKVDFRTPKKRPKSAQKCPKEAQDRPKPSPNRAQDPPKSEF